MCRLFAPPAGAEVSSDAPSLSVEGHKIEFLSEKVLESDAFTLQIAASDGRVWREDYTGFHLPEIDLRSAFDDHMPDGQYHYEILPHSTPIFGTIAPELRGLEPSAGPVPSADSGTFTIQGGRGLDPNLLEEMPAESLAARTKSTNDLASDSDEGTRDQVIADDLIVIGSECVGFDCVNGEVFGFDTIRLKESNLRIAFVDTSSAGGFPTVDWELIANDSANGGANHSSIFNRDAGSTPFRVDAGAPTNALRINSSGDVELGTGNPVVELHVTDGDTPTLRLEQNSSSGFAPQTWDIAGNETNFFVRDATNGSTLPFRIRPGAPSISIHIAPGGNVGIGTASPTAPLHLLRGNNTAEFSVEDTGASSTQILLWLANNGSPFIRFENTAVDDQRWSVGLTGSGANERFEIFKLGSGTAKMQLFQNGDMTISGTLIQGSSRTIKERITELNTETVLARLEALTVHEWSYRKTPENRHASPIAEDFYAAFELGSSDKHIAPGDLAGVALAAAKALHERNRELEDKNRSLEARLERIEALLLEGN